MGFSEEDSIAALKATNNDPDAATAWLLGEREEETGGTVTLGLCSIYESGNSYPADFSRFADGPH